MSARVRRALLLACLVATAPAFPAAAAAEDVTIVRDARGEPTIRGQSARGAMYGFAWAQMEDQAPYILESIAQATGRSAELIGPDCRPNPQADPSLAACFRQDQLTRLFRNPETATAGFNALPPEDRARLQRFADGINAYIASGASNLPSWAQPVTAQDVLANVLHKFLFAQVGQISDILAGGGAQAAAASRTLAAAPRLELPASNMFALRSTKTYSDKPILQGNPHLPFDGASRWYAAQVSYPGTRVRGITFRGLPGIAMGSNDYLAWAHTANHNAQHEQDAYVVVPNPSNPNQYLYNGSYRNMTVRTITMKVKTAGGVQAIPVTLRYTHHGPIISDPLARVDGTQPPPSGFTVAAKLSLYGEFRLPSQSWRQAEARSVADFKQAMALNQLSSFNTLVADDQDNIFFAATSRSGILNPGVEPNSILDGSNPANDWQGILPFSQLPQAQNPASGYYQNANNAPQFTAPGQISVASIPFYLRGGGNTSRSRRQVDLLGSQTSLSAPFDVTLADAEEIGMDSFLEFAPSLVSLLEDAADDPGADPKVAFAAAYIDAWPGAERLFATKGSTAYTLFATWKRGLRQPALGFAPNNPPPPTTIWTAAQKAEARRAMIVAWDGMTAQYGTVATRYGLLHRYAYGTVNSGVNGGDSGLETLRLTNCKGDLGSESPIYYFPCAVKGGAGAIWNSDLATDRLSISRAVADTGDPSSPFYPLNARDYVNDRYRLFPTTDAAVDAEQTSRRTLTLP